MGAHRTVNQVPVRERPGASARVVRSAMRLFARWWKYRASAPATSPQVPLPVAVRGARAILVVALAEAGDMVLLSVFLRELRRLAPSAHVTLVCLPGVRVLYEASSDVDEVIAYDAAAPRLLRPLLLPRRARAFARSRLVVPFDVAVVPRWDTDHHLAAVVALFSGAPRRIGHSEQSNARKQTLNAGFDALFTNVVLSEGVAHEVERHLELLHALGATAPANELRVALTGDDRRRAAEALSALSGAGPLIAFGIGAAHPKRRWPLAGFAEVGRELQRAYGARLVVVGGPADVHAQSDLLGELGPGAIGVAGQLTLRESAAVLERCQLFVGSDSAPMHLAAAVGIPCVEISCHPAGGDPLHNNAPERFAPWGVASRVVRPAAAVPPCTSQCDAERPHCILAITPALVLDSAGALLDRTASARAHASAVTPR
jgi:ADP-heptose:LPS heptosyltransferase